jgi:membrane protease YdiL (CAAX protease family)
MRKKSSAFEQVLALLLCGFLFFASCQGNISAVSTDISKESLRCHMEFIASSETQGRMTASEGYKKAADYAVEQFRSFGVEPGWADASGGRSYYQSVPFILNQYGKSTVLSVRNNGKIEELSLGPDTFVVANPGKGSLNLPPHSPVFVGYGIHEPELGWDDFSGLEIQGKIAVMIAGFPSNSQSGPDFPDEVRRKYSDRRMGDALRFQSVMMGGAAGIIALPDPFIAAQWEGIVSQLKRSTLLPEEAYGPSSRGESPIPSLLVHALVAIVLQMFFFKDSPIYYQTYKEKPRWIFFGFIIITFLYGILTLLAAFDPESGQIYQGLGSLLYTLWILSVFFIHSQSDEGSFERAGLRLGKVKMAQRFIGGILLFLLLQAGFNLLFKLGPFVGKADRIYGLPIPSSLYIPAIIVLFVLVTVIGVPLSGIAGVFGEEYGWRGFLQSELTKLGNLKGVLLVGLIWGIWHFPVILRGVHTYPASLLGLILGTVFFVLWGIIQG